MRVFRDIDHLDKAARGATLVLGSFDGVHRGHAALIETARRQAFPVGVLTFAPHPRLIVQPKQPPFLLTPGNAKHIALRGLGVDLCVELPFTYEFASMSADAFVAHILVERLAARHLIFGENFRFGAGRQGDAALLHKLGARYGFSVNHVAPVLDESGEIYSSTRIRNCLRVGDVAGAAAVLGRPWTIRASLQSEPAGNGLAASFRFGEHLKPLPGHYNVRLHDADRGPVDAHLIVASDEDVGWLDVGDGMDLRELPSILIEFVEFLGALTTALQTSETRMSDVCYL